MKIRHTLTAALGVAAMLAASPALAQDKNPNCQPSASPRTTDSKAPVTAPPKIEGTVTNIDADKGMITVRGSDGTTHQFQGSAETLKEYKKGDRLDLTLRQLPPC